MPEEPKKWMKIEISGRPLPDDLAAILLRVRMLLKKGARSGEFSTTGMREVTPDLDVAWSVESA